MLGTLALSIALVVTPPSKDEIAIRATCDQIAKAIQTQDWAKYRTLNTKNFIQINDNNTKSNLEQLIRGFRSSFQGLAELAISYRINKLTIKGNTATAQATWSLSAKTRLRARMQQFVTLDEEVDTFTKVNGKWLQAKVVVNSFKTLMDGKVVQSHTRG